jgi:hypothetical protein
MREPLALALGLNLPFATVYKSVAGTFRTQLDVCLESVMRLTADTGSIAACTKQVKLDLGAHFCRAWYGPSCYS